MDFEIRADGVLHIEGYVNAVERDSRIVMCPECGKCVEQIAAGAFGNALRAAKNVDMLLNHDKGRKIGSTSEGTLTLAEDSIGLRASADITDEEAVEKARNGLLRGWSFGFKATDTEIEQRSQGVPRRHVKALNISEVSLIDDRYRPCYAGTSIELRADEEGAEEADFTELRFDTLTCEKTEPDTPDYSSYEARLARARMRELELRAEELELRFNPYHDPTNGRFTTANGGGSGGFLYSKGGKSAYVFERDIDSEYEAWTKSKAAKASHNADRNFKLDAFLREKHNNMTDANNVVSARDVEDYINYKIGMHNIWLSTNLSVGSKTYDRPAKIDFNLGKSIDIMVDNTPAAAKGIEEAFSDLKKAGFEVKKIPDSYYDKKFYNITRKKGTRTSVWEKDMPERFDHIKREKEAFDWNSPTNWRSP